MYRKCKGKRSKLMPRERIVLIGLAALLVVGLILGAVSSGIAGGQQAAWMEGYTMGRLTAAAGVDGAVAPLAPYAGYGAPYALGPGFGHRGPGFGGVLLILLGMAALFFIGSRLVMRERWRAWAAMQGAQAGGAPGVQDSPSFGPGVGPHGPWHMGPPWGHGRRGCGPWQAYWEQAERAQNAPGAQTAQTSPEGDLRPTPDQPVADR
jgi:hypothetical protein